MAAQRKTTGGRTRRGGGGAGRWQPRGGSSTTLALQKPLERVIAHGHPWVYADALVAPPQRPGELADLLDTRGRFLARGICERGPIGLRILTLDRDASIDDAFWRERLQAALSLRAHLDLTETDAYRLVHGEADRLPGLVVDRYAEHAVLRLDGAGLSTWRDRIVPHLVAALEPLGVKHVHQVQGRGPSKSLDCLHGHPIQAPLVVQERGMKLVVDLVRGQKTGMFLDHRETRAQVRDLCAKIRKRRGDAPLRVLNLYGYTGGFSVAAGLGGASEVTTVDISAPALEMARRSWQANDLPMDAHEIIAAKAEQVLGDSELGVFDVVIADPPSFAPNEKAKAKALGAYRAMHRSCLAAVRLGGFYVTASCSSHIDRAAFETTLREGAHGAGVSLQILARAGAGADHPVLLGFAAGDYLCALTARVSPKVATSRSQGR